MPLNTIILNLQLLLNKNIRIFGTRLMTIKVAMDIFISRMIVKILLWKPLWKC